MKRDKKIEIRVSEAEKAAIIEKAGDTSLSDYIRGVALNCHDKEDVKQERHDTGDNNVMTRTEVIEKPEEVTIKHEESCVANSEPIWARKLRESQIKLKESKPKTHLDKLRETQR